MIEAILGDRFVGHAEQVVQTGRSVPVLGQGELAARRAQTIDDFDGHDIGGPNGLLARRDVPLHDGVEIEQVPQPVSQKDIAEAASVGPADLFHADANDIRVVGQGHRVIVGKQAQLLSVALAIVEDDGALPTAFLVGVEFAEIGDDLLAWPGVGANALNQSEVGVLLAGLGADVAAEEHPGLPRARWGDPGRLRRRFPLQRDLASDSRKRRHIRARNFQNGCFQLGSAQGRLADCARRVGKRDRDFASSRSLWRRDGSMRRGQSNLAPLC